jgi:hypothetical protein
MRIVSNETINLVDNMNYTEISRWGAFIDCLDIIFNESKKLNISYDQIFKKLNCRDISEYVEAKSDYYLDRMIKEDNGGIV